MGACEELSAAAWDRTLRGWCDALALEKRDCAAGLEGLGQAGV